MKNLLFVVNPISGDKDKTTVTEQFIARAEQAKYIPFCYETTGEKDEESIISILNKQNFERVVVAGGDGTVKMVCKTILQKEITLGILPQGSANGLAKSLNLPNSEDELYTIALSENSIALNVIEINGDICIHLSDAGFNAKIIKKYEQGEQRGFLGYASQLIDTLKENSPIDFTLTMNDVDTVYNAQMVVVGNAPKYGFGGLINPLGKVDDGLFDIVIVKATGLPQFIKMMTNASEHQYTNDEVIMLQGKKAVITFNQPAPFQIDGEYLGEQKQLNITMRKEKIAVCVPTTH